VKRGAKDADDCPSLVGHSLRMTRVRNARLGTLARRVVSGSRVRLARAGLVPGRLDPRLVWIFGSPRSGSTWLLQLLAEHRAVVPVNEPLIGWYLGVCTSDLGADPASLDLNNFTLRRLRRGDRSNMFSNDFRDVWLPAVGRLLRTRFYVHAIRCPSRVPLSRTLIAIKEPNGSQSADLIMAALPRARLLFLLRDGRDVVDSELAASLKDGWVTKEFPGAPTVSPDDRLAWVTNSAYKWLWRTEVVQRAFAEHQGPKYLVRYEDILHDPFSELRSVFAWLGLEVSEHELNEWIRRNSFGELPAEVRGPDKFFRAAAPGLWRTNLTAEENAAVDTVIGRKLHELGYHG
jgi:hypothetical protein